MSFERGKRGAAALLVAAAVAVAGCGGGGSSNTLSKSEYSQKVKNVGTQLQNTFKDLNSGGNNKDLSTLATKLGTAAGALRSSAGQLDNVNPPKDAKSDNDALVKGMRGLAGAVDQLKAAAQKKDAKALQAAVQKFQTSSTLKDLQTATDDLKKKGYDIGVLGQ